MANALGRISGQLLKDNLTRSGNDLKFDEFGSTDPLLNLNVTGRYISVNSDTTFRPLYINGKTLTSDLISLNGLQGSSNLKLSVSGNTIVSTQDLNLFAATQVNANIIDTDNIRIDGNVISTKTLNTVLDITPAGSLDIYNKLNVTGNLWAKETAPSNGTGRITLDGNITFGSDGADTISFAADINTDINPNVDELYSIGSISQKWEGLYTALINGEQVSSTSIASGGIDLASRQGKIWYVASNGLDTNVGDHQNGAFATIKHALDESSAGDTVYIYPGTYTEIFPLTVKVGVTVKGTGIRSVTVQPTVLTQSNNAFLLNGESTISDLTVKDFYAPGYAFAFAPGFTVSTRSPYVQNITVITTGSVTSVSDPRGFDEGDAGGGAYVDGSLATSASKEASMLFHSVTFITPGVDALVMTNGVRVEWLNSFSYFANRGMYATNGTLGLASLGIRFGAEIRSIGSANVYGNYGAEADGASTLMYLIQHNFAYIGAGKDVTNDPSLNIAANETVELASGKIYYQSLDNKGNFKVGDAFGVSFETGLVTINGVSVSAGGVTSINFAAGTDETVIDATQVTVNNVTFSNNLISTLSGALNLDSGTGEIKLNANTDVTDNLIIDGNFNIDGQLTIGNAYIDIVRFEAPVEFDLRPVTDDDYTLGGPTNKSWDFVYLDTSYIGSYKLENATISTLPTNADVELRADTTGKIYVPTNNVEFDNDLTVDSITALKNTVIGSTALASSLSFSSSSYLSLSAAQTIGTQAYTFECFFYTASNGLQTILGATATGGMSVWLFGDGTNPVTIIQIDRSNIDAAQYTVSPITLNTWHHLAVTRDSLNNASVFLDGVKATGSTSNTANYTASSGLIGAVAGSAYFFTGYLTQIKLAVGSNYYDPTAASISVPTAVLTTSANTKLLLIVANSGAYLTDTSGTQTVSNTGGVTYSATGPSTSDITHVGDYVQTGNTLQTGNREITNTLDVTNNVYFDNINIVDNRIFTTNLNDSLELRAAGTTGKVIFNEITEFSQNALFGTLESNGLGNSGTITSDIFSDSDIEINDNYITTTVGNNDLRLVPNGTGKLSLPLDPLAIDQALTVEDTSTLKSVNMNGNLVHVGTTSQTGNVTQTGNFDLSNDLTVTGTNAFFTDVRIINNSIATSTGNNNLELRANGTGIINITDFAAFGQTLTVNGITSTTTLSTVTGTITSDIFTDSDIEINDNYITTTVGNNNLILTANGTGGAKLEKLKFNAGTISTESNNDSIILSIPAGNLLIDSATALKIPVGTTVNRPTLTQGELRFDTTDNLFRGYSASTVTFAGVYSADRLTKVLAHPTNNTIGFTTNNSTSMTVSSTGFNINALAVDNLLFANSTISSTATNTDITLNPNGTGYVKIGDIALETNEFLNLNATNPLILQNTGAGYIKFAGTYGLAIPSGDINSRPLLPETGDLRWNTELSEAEVFNGVNYQALSGSGGDLLNAEEVQEATNLWALVLG